MSRRNKVLIIKVGHSETLDPEISSVTSYGDVLRTTVLLHLFKNDHVTWLVDEWAYPILRGNGYIDRILIFGLDTVLQLQAEHFDTVINLEKVPGICALTDSIKAWRRYGFRFDERSGCADAYDGTQEILEVCLNIEKKRRYASFWQEGLYEMVNARWDGEEYVLGYKSKAEATFDIGFNHQVGNKWSSKAWPMEHWKKLEKLIGDRYAISWQQGLENMEEYFDWVRSCRAIITNDSFGLHLALAMKRYVVGLFGPTNPREIFLYGRGSVLTPTDPDCDEIPCCAPSCGKEKPCMANIRPEDVSREIDRVFQEGLVRQTCKS